VSTFSSFNEVTRGNGLDMSVPKLNKYSAAFLSLYTGKKSAFSYVSTTREAFTRLAELIVSYLTNISIS